MYTRNGVNGEGVHHRMLDLHDLLLFANSWKMTVMSKNLRNYLPAVPEVIDQYKQHQSVMSHVRKLHSMYIVFRPCMTLLLKPVYLVWCLFLFKHSFPQHLDTSITSRLEFTRTKEINSCVIPNSLEDLGEFLAIYPELSGTSSAICPGTCRNLISLSFLPQNPERSGTLSAICTGTLQNLISHLHRNLISHLHRNLISHLHRKDPDLLRNLLRNLVLQLHRITPELFWAKDPIASFAVGEKKTSFLRTSDIQVYSAQSFQFKYLKSLFGAFPQHLGDALHQETLRDRWLPSRRRRPRHASPCPPGCWQPVPGDWNIETGDVFMSEIIFLNQNISKLEAKFMEAKKKKHEAKSF